MYSGMPYPKNFETAKEVEVIVRMNGAVPATIAILDGIPCVGVYISLFLVLHIHYYMYTWSIDHQRGSTF